MSSKFIAKLHGFVFGRADKTKKKKKTKFLGDFENWDDALLETTSYESNSVFKNTFDAITKVRDGDAVFERDSRLFDKPQFPFALISTLLKVAYEDQTGSIELLDFGGSLGSSYFQCKPFFNALETVKWGVVEQDYYYNAGRKHFENSQLKFYENIEQCQSELNLDMIVFSSVLQYLRDPYEILHKVFDLQIPYVFVDRTSFWYGDCDRITKQEVNPEIYEASYPCWFFCEQVFLELFTSNGYVLEYDFKALDKARITEGVAYYKGFLFKRITPNS